MRKPVAPAAGRDLDAMPEWRTLGGTVLLGLAFGAGTSLLNHAPALGLVAAVVGSGAGWVAVGVVAATVLGARRPDLGLTGRIVVAAVLYLAACLAYYACDWVLALPGILRLRDDVASGRVPDPGGTHLTPDLTEWLLWSAASFPGAVLVTCVSVVALRAYRPASAELSRPAR